MARKNARRNISRIECVSTANNLNCGWVVRMARRGEKVEKYFADNKHGGKAGALREAKKFRDELENTMQHYSASELAKNPSVRNTSGIVGVRISERTDVRGECECTFYFWVAQWTDGKGRRKTRSFSINKFGYDKAFQMAVNARKKGIKKKEA